MQEQQESQQAAKSGHPHVDGEQKKARDLADEAAARADATSLHRLFLQEQAKYRELLRGFDALVSVYAGSDSDRRNREPEDSSAVQAMRDVALEAIELAKLHLCKPDQS